MGARPVLEVRDLSIHFETRNGVAKVIENLDFSLMPGEVLGIVGESGCGKSMTALSIMGLIPMPPGKVAKGEIILNGRNLLGLSPAEMRKVRGNEVAMVFQEPMTALNPVFTIGEQIAETVMAHQDCSHREAMARAVEMLRLVGIPSPDRRAAAFPHELSGGMRQRVMIAMALVCEPDLLICDEPTTALDVTVQAQVLDLLRELRDRTGTAIIMITHDMGVVAEMADKVLVMYAGRKVEEGSTRDIIRRPTHPYTEGLIRCVPALKSDFTGAEDLPEIPGIVPALTALGTGCVFAPRCALAIEKCEKSIPAETPIGDGHSVSCWIRSEGGIHA